MISMAIFRGFTTVVDDMLFVFWGSALHGAT
jgi:hypothetical protein